MIKVGNLDKVNNDLDLWVKLIETKVKQRAISITISALSWLTLQSPQYSGDFVANWKVGVGKPDSTFQPGALGSSLASKYVPGFDVKRRGDREGIDIAILNASVPIGSIAFGSKVYITNNAVHDDPYAVLIERNQIAFRPENAGAGELIKRYVNVFGSTGGRA